MESYTPMDDAQAGPEGAREQRRDVRSWRRVHRSGQGFCFRFRHNQVYYLHSTGKDC